MPLLLSLHNCRVAVSGIFGWEEAPSDNIPNLNLIVDYDVNRRLPSVLQTQ